MEDESQFGNPPNNSVSYHFPDGSNLSAVQLHSPHVPNVGDRVAMSALERVKEPLPHQDYGNRKYWRVKERIFAVTVPVTHVGVVRVGTQQRVEVLLEAVPED